MKTSPAPLPQRPWWPVPLVALAVALGAARCRNAAAQQAQPALAQPAAQPAAPDPELEEEVSGGALDAGTPSLALPNVRVELLTNRSTAVARGTGVLVTAEELQTHVTDAPEPTQLDWARDPQRLEGLVDRLVADRVMAAEARRLGLENDPQVRAAVERALVARLRALQVNPAADAQPSATPDDVRAFYDAHPERFHIPERRRVWVLFVPDRRLGERLLHQLRLAPPARRGPLFRQLQGEQHRDPDLLRLNGDFHELTALSTELDPAARDAAFALETPGEFSALLAGRWGLTPGYFVVRYVSRRPPIERTLAESSDWIRLRLALERRVRAEQQLVARLTSAAHVTRTPASSVVRLVAPVDAGMLARP